MLDAVLGRIPGCLVLDAGALSHDGGAQHLSGDVECGTAHVNDWLDGRQETNTGQWQAERRKRQGEHHRCAGGACGSGGTDNGHEDDEQVLGEVKVDAIELGDEDGRHPDHRRCCYRAKGWRS